MPTGLEISSLPVAGDEPADRGADLLRDDAGHAHGLPGRLDRPEPFAAQDEAEAVRTVRLRRCDRAEDDRLAVPLDGDRIGSPPEPEMRSAISSAATVLPLIATIRSSGRSPIFAAGVPATISSTVRVALPPPAMKSSAKRITARSRFAPGPAKMTATRFQVFARQYASGASASPMLAETALGGLERDGRQTRLVDLGGQARDGVARALVVALLEARAQLVHRTPERWVLLDRSSEVDGQIPGRGAVHARNLHVAAERDRADAVLDPVPLRLHERRREAEVELARVHPDAAGDEEVTGLVDRGSGIRARGSRRRCSCRRARPVRRGGVQPHPPPRARQGRSPERLQPRRSPPRRSPRSRGTAAVRRGRPPRRPRWRR